MVMRYHWGLAVGHVYARHTSQMTSIPILQDDDADEADTDIGEAETESVDETMDPGSDVDVIDGLRDEEDEGDDELFANYEMYGFSRYIEQYE